MHSVKKNRKPIKISLPHFKNDKYKSKLLVFQDDVDDVIKYSEMAANTNFCPLCLIMIISNAGEVLLNDFFFHVMANLFFF